MFQIIKQFATRAYNKLKRVLGSPLFFNKFEDRFRTYRWLHSAKGRVSLDQLRACSTPGEIIDFARASVVFPPHQVRSELLSFIEFARQESPKTVVEIGTAQSGTHFVLGQALLSVTMTVAIDLLVMNTAVLRHLRRPECVQHFIDGSSRSGATLKQLKHALGGKPIDLLFIDGDHTYEGVKSDYFLYRDLVCEGGLIVFHDIVPDFKTRYGRNTGNWAGDVPVFWAEVKEGKETWEFVENRDQDGLGIGVLRHSREHSGN